ncbi:MAG: toxin [Elusimicrobia bacterium]|nr:toxin [Elusimicrobiota bacterium]
MKPIRWNQDEDEWLQANRGIGFDLAALKIGSGEIIALTEHPNKARYPHQKVYVLEFHGYAYLVPFVETEDGLFLKTIFPSRQATKLYLGGGKHGETH